ncbi:MULTISPECIES: LysR family transcriptional regulator [unclassified Aliivibrio]|uniref:LysR family transcriptional regulator n=1 Tax=unclassified Aliivibrio TaxID=2645654 RepID=UPI00080DE1FE|nr:MULTISPECIES: LysR family transcriptional regulator [unclassified Aliivibrio]OCH17341.1 hypothetical protein A6E05_13700 [Aliivibrio sp. 1S165]OCH23601.1 hypothetical protein A6E03_08095 [Aliivibrio sp. 1S128]OCH34335.1 hypothetical protein A6E06_00440 [Aliivibrio sp. 1S175]
MSNELNYNLLKVLILLNEQRNLKKVANILGNTESAISKHLSKLREQIGDPLFIRGNVGLEPTLVLQEMLPQIENALQQIDNAIFPESKFIASEYKNTIHIAMHSVTIKYYASKIYSILRKRFPHSVIVIETWTEVTEQEILDGKIQIGVNFLNADRTKQIYQKKLLETVQVIAVSHSHGANTWEEVIQAPFAQIRVSGWNDKKQHFVDVCRKNGIRLNYQLRTDDLMALQRFVLDDNMAMVGIRAMMDEKEFKFIEIPEKLRINLSFAACIKLTNRSSPLHIELEKIIQKIIV